MNTTAAAPLALRAARALLVVVALGAAVSPPAANLAALLALACVLAAPGSAARLRALLALPAARATLACLAVLAAAMLWSAAPWSARFAAWWSWRPLLLVLAGWLAFAGDAPAQSRFARNLGFAFAACAVLSLLAWAWPEANPLADRERGILLRDHVTQGMAMVAGMVLLVAGLAGAQPRGRVLRYLAIAALLADVAIVCSGRSSHVALVVASVVLALGIAPRAWRARAAGGAALLALAALLASPMVRDRFELAVHEVRTADDASVPVQGESSMGLRLAIWRRTASIIADHPLLGVGKGGFAAEYAARIPPDATGSQAARAKDTHNQYLRVQVEAGIPGTIAFLAMVLSWFRQRAALPWRAAGLAVLCAWLATSLFNSHFETFDAAHLLGVLLGALLAPAAALQAGASASSDSARDSTSA